MLHIGKCKYMVISRKHFNIPLEKVSTFTIWVSGYLMISSIQEVLSPF